MSLLLSQLAIPDDDQNHWWSGAMHNMARVAVAGLVAANTLAAQLPVGSGEQQDEVPSQPVPYGGQMFSGPVQGRPLVVKVFNSDDEWVSSSSTTVVEEEYWQVILPPAMIKSPQAVIADDEIPHFYDEDYWRVTLPPYTVKPSSPAITVEDEIPHFYDEDYWQNRTTPTPLTFQPNKAFLADDEAVWIRGDNDDPWAVIQPVVPPPIVTAVNADDDWVPPSTATMAEEEYWQNSVAPVPQGFVVPQAWTFDQNEQANNLYVAYDDDAYQSPILGVPGKIPIVFRSDDDIVPQPSTIVDDTDAWVIPSPQAQIKLAKAALADDEIPHFYDEDYWQVILPAPVRVPLRVITADDEIIVVQPLGVDEEYWAFPVPAWQFAQSNLAFQADDEVVTPPPDAGPVGGFPAQVMRRGPQFIRQAVDDDWISTIGNLGVDDPDNWNVTIIPPQVVPVRAFLTDDEIVPQPPPLSVEEEYWAVIPPPPAVLPPLQATSADDELGYPLHIEEEYWAFPVPKWKVSQSNLAFQADDEKVTVPTGGPVAGYPGLAMKKGRQDIRQHVDVDWVPFVPDTPLNLEEEYWINPVPATVFGLPPQATVEDDWLVPFVAPTAIIAEDEGYQPPIFKQRVVTLQAFLADDDYSPTSDGSEGITYSISSSVSNLVFTQPADDDWVQFIAPTPLNLDEEPWILGGPRPTPLTFIYPSPAFDAGEIVPFVAPTPLGIDDDYTVIIPSIKPVTPPRQAVQADDETDFSHNYASYDQVAFLAVEIIDRPVIAFSIDDDWVPSVAPTPLNIEEEYWINPVAPVPLTFQQNQAFLADDEHIQFVPPTGLMEFPWSVPLPRVSKVSTVLAFQADDDSYAPCSDGSDGLLISMISPAANTVAPFITDEQWVPFVASNPLGVEEEYWQVIPPQAEIKPSRQAIVVDDEVVHPLGFDEDYWAVIPAPPAIRPPRQAIIDDDVTMQFLSVLEEYWQNRVAPVPSSFRPLNIWSYEQHDSSGTLGQARPDEVHWSIPQPQPPYITTAAVLADDEIIPFIAPVPLNLDEDYPFVFTIQPQLEPQLYFYDNEYFRHRQHWDFGYILTASTSITPVVSGNNNSIQPSNTKADTSIVPVIKLPDDGI